MTPFGRNLGRSRRWFLVHAIGAPVMATVAEACSRLAPRPEPVESEPSAGLRAEDRSMLRFVVDEIIPGADEMPAASEVGSLEYLEQLARDHSEIRGELETGLSGLARLSIDAVAVPFTSLSHPRRVHALSELEKRAPRQFAILRDYTYEAYYTRPQVWRLIGYDGHLAPDERWNDDALLAPVRAMPRLYRPVI
jgi:hypothetical protein